MASSGIAGMGVSMGSGTYLGRQLYDIVAGNLRNTGLAININQGKAITGINQVRVGDLRVYMPYFRPVPGVVQKTGRNVPEGVTLNYGVTLGMIGPQLRCSMSPGGYKQRSC